MAMETSCEDVYLTCTRRKGHPKKHISVCHKCRWSKSCVVYRRFCQPELPLEKNPRKPSKPPSLPFTIVKAPTPRPDQGKLLSDIRKALHEIRDLCT